MLAPCKNHLTHVYGTRHAYTFILLLYNNAILSMVQQYDQFQVSVDTFPLTLWGMWLLKLLQLVEVLLF